MAGFNGRSIGTTSAVNPYHDPKWMNWPNGSGGTYDGANPPFYSALSSVRGMFYDQGKLYYANGGSSLQWLPFSPDSGIVGPSRRRSRAVDELRRRRRDVRRRLGSCTTSSAAPATCTRSTGPARPRTGSATLVNGPSNGGRNWNGTGALPRKRPAEPGADRVVHVLLRRADLSPGRLGVDRPRRHDHRVVVGAGRQRDGQRHDGGAHLRHCRAEVGHPHGHRQLGCDGPPSPRRWNRWRHRPERASSPAPPRPTPPAPSSRCRCPRRPRPVTPCCCTGSVTRRQGRRTRPAGPGCAPSPSAPRSRRSCGPSRPALPTRARPSPSPNRVSRRTTAQLLVYRGYSGVAASAAVTDSGTATHLTPAQAVLTGDYVVAFFADRSTTTSSWTAGAGQTARGSVLGTSTTRYSTFVSDADAPVSAGTDPGTSAVVNAPSTQGDRDERGPAALTR